VVLLAGGASWAQAPVEILQQSMVYQHPPAEPDGKTNVQGFNHGPSIILLPDGRLMVAWFSAPFEGADSQKILHAFSSDAGRTWTPATVLQDLPGRTDFDPAFVSNGRDVFFFFSSRAQPLHQLYLRRSSDSAATWSAPELVEAAPGHTSRSNGIRLSTGELLMPIHSMLEKRGRVLKSSDDGKTWRGVGQITDASGFGQEPTLAELKTGRLLLILRTRDGFIWRSTSHDRGETWSTAEKSGLTGGVSSHNLFRLRNGTLILTSNSTPGQRYPLTMRLSKDDGTTWTPPVTLADRPASGERIRVCYPSVAQLPDDSLVIVWAEYRNEDDERWGNIHAAKVSVR
jgi:sialidase-1